MTETQEKPAQGETHAFQAEVSRLLDIVVHSLYSQKEIFLRELISNAADACDRLRYEALTRPELTQDEGADYKIRLDLDETERTISIADNGIGMNHDDLVDSLGTIAKSGTANFLNNLTGDAQQDAQLIGQFGVGFYSVFMVARQVEVITRKAGESQGWRWISDGRGSFEISPAENLPRGTTVVLHLAEGEDEFLDAERLKEIVRRYSDHIPIPVVMQETTTDDEGNEQVQDTTVNRASALWKRPKNEITEEEYKEFYRHVGHQGDEPWLTIHWKAEGTLEYTALLYIPSSRPFDLFHPDRANRVKLYVRRVYITEDCKDLLPSWLRFLRGVVDSEDLPLNVSREMLQNNPALSKMRNQITRRVLQELEKKAENEPENYATFWENFGAVLKEGIYEDSERQEQLLKLARFRTTKSPDSAVSLADYYSRMKENQTAIYYIAGDDLEALKKSPQLEGFKAKDVEVLLLTDPVDEFWVSTADYDGKPFKSVTRAGADLDNIKGPEDDSSQQEAPDKEHADQLIEAIKEALGDQIKDVRSSNRLTDSPVCLVADETGLDMHLERLLKQHNQLNALSQRILEINPKHGVMKAMANLLDQEGGAETVKHYAPLLLDQARIVEGESVVDPAGFAQRMGELLEKGLGGTA